ncbi:hypothetical protein A2154_02305 [Candidatus Gottesmanbacteria bacterium RBG_16_43_7]|uniref:Transcriptional repressor PaaX-like central Cas2-like domain-containing protein n=1 Tax=Candidatus Gottesmanbacteria bacterium RBG_16_43_7 TaxID=1798373 RepID=A0A1F5ZAM8_9BACT|nr:MAG: hypothetical protein A2154_02305 [Candidatus Gottesmanbacteria bacterium RBG_16_43_7]
MKKQKLINILEDQDQVSISITKAGRNRILKYALDDFHIENPKQWDGKWRLIVYDVEDRRKHLRDIFRKTVKNLGFYQLQKSVWIYPYPCEQQISFLREYYGVGNEVLYIVATHLEDDTPLREYFGLS